eukprot:GEMP01065361.1.p1 GENE.GEMP01065361.1~~GEMP01065361.1.p1  ORF type:complete len:118 (-),score=7.53 GEMP01065361.1:170-523(-)
MSLLSGLETERRHFFGITAQLHNKKEPARKKTENHIKYPKIPRQFIFLWLIKKSAPFSPPKYPVFSTQEIWCAKKNLPFARIKNTHATAKRHFQQLQIATKHNKKYDGQPAKLWTKK